MTKTDYIHNVKNNQSAIVYEYYKLKNKRPPFLSYHEFMTFAQLSLDMNKAFEIARNHFEDKFNIVYLLNKENQIITIL
jgi:hypothetical protein